MKLTPMMQQYMGFKKQYPDKILLFRMGDFYETFGEDAKQTAKILNITLTSRDKDKDPTPLAGFPYHALDQYLPKIVQAGESAVIVDQIEDPKQAVGVVKRGVTRIVTQGTLDGELAPSQKNQYVISFYKSKNILGVALVDISTGQFLQGRIGSDMDSMEQVLNSYDPSEAVLPQDSSVNLPRDITLPIQLVDTKELAKGSAEDRIKRFYSVKSLDSFGMVSESPEVYAVAMLLSYIAETQKMDPVHLDTPKNFSFKGKMILDRATIRNLDLVANSYTGSMKESLLSVLDHTKTRMGKRLLYNWILNPLTDKGKIEERLDVVNYLYENENMLGDLREALSLVSDVERIVGKIGLNRMNAKDLNALQVSLEKISEIDTLTHKVPQIAKFLAIHAYFDGKSSLGDLIKLLSSSIHDSPPQTITDGGVIKNGYNAEVDELREISGNSKDWMDRFIQEKKEECGIPTMKVGYNKVFGYYIEVSRAYADKVPASYVRKQTLVNAERYITPELKEKEDIILGAHSKLVDLEYKLFQEIRDETLKYIEEVKRVGNAVAKLDVTSSFATAARQNSYTRPSLHAPGKKKGVLSIVGGRHPVVEQLSDGEFIQNDTLMHADGKRMFIITGPNMSGKSTFIRQVALIVLMAQIGSYVPASSCEIAIVDRIFSRVGAADNLSQGRSTFMVEMEESANILNNATGNSLVILDEVGRGTSTYDGVSIAWSLTEYLVENIGARTLFATHYHELTQLEQEHPKYVSNLNVHVEESGDEVVFMRKIIPGGTDRSYGIYVAQMAGLPKSVISRAKDILKSLEDRAGKKGKVVSAAVQYRFLDILEPQLEDSNPNKESSTMTDEILKELNELDLDNLTPLEALGKLDALVKLAESK